MKVFRISLIAIVALLFVGCYNDFDMPEPAKIYTNEDMEAMGLEHVSIKAVKDKFKSVYRTISGTGSNKSWSDTKTLKFGQLSTAEEEMGTIKAWEEAENYYIKGKVLSDDKQGNVYKSLFIYDGSAAIEIKLSNDNYLKYPQGSWVYIKLNDLYLGNYRMMLSIGEGPTDSYNAMGEHKFYANSNIENTERIKEHVFRGEQDVLVEGQDIIVINKDNYKTMLTDDTYFGCLLKFVGVKCYYAGVPYNTNGDKYPSLKNGSYEQIYPSWIDTNTRNPVVSKPWYKWSFNHENIFLYGSVCFTYLDDIETATHYTSDKGIYIVRSSGYSRFAGRTVVRHGAVGDITAIYGIYSQQSDFAGGQNDYATYQLTINRFEDMHFSEDAYLTSEEFDAMTPTGYDADGNYDPMNDSYFVPSKETSERE